MQVEVLEAENGKLRAELKAAVSQAGPHYGERKHTSNAEGSSASTALRLEIGTPNLDTREYDQVKDDFIKLEHDYGRLARARDVLENTVRHQKDTIKQWREYRKKWILRHPIKQPKDPTPGVTKGICTGPAQEQRFSSSPPPPIIPEGVTPSMSNSFRSLSPNEESSTGSEQQSIQILGDRNINAQTKSNGVFGGDSEHPIKAPDEPEVIAGTKPVQIEESDNEKLSRRAQGGSSPIVVSERSVKRRRTIRMRDEGAHVHEDDQHPTRNMPKPVLVKAERSSSPLLAPPDLLLGEPHDSLDLDDVGDLVDTPRKRRRLAQERLRCSMAARSAAAHENSQMSNNVVASIFQHHQWDPSKIKDHQNQQHGVLMEKTKASSPRMAENDNQVPWIDKEKARKVGKDVKIARQQAHNDRVYERLEAAERGSSGSEHPKSANDEPHQSDSFQSQQEAEQRKAFLASTTVLQPTDPNAHVLPRTSESVFYQKRRSPLKRRDHGAAYVPALAEDGEGLSFMGNSSTENPRTKQSHPMGNAEKVSKAQNVHRRLGALMTGERPAKPLLTFEEPDTRNRPDEVWMRTPTARSDKLDRPQFFATPLSLPAKRVILQTDGGSKSCLAKNTTSKAVMAEGSKSARAANKTMKASPIIRKPRTVGHPPEVPPEQETLRARPIHRLGLDDFKLNPAHSDYAYHDSVRRHDEKKALSGCVDRHCPRCKDLRKFVIDSGYKTAQKPGESEEEADQRLLEEYLGDRRHSLRRMPATEKSEILIEAKVKQFANLFGKHRQAYARTREAPGLWDVDFPTTQQDQENREAAGIIEREKVEERYWEATRSGGKWIFRDE